MATQNERHETVERPRKPMDEELAKIGERARGNTRLIQALRDTQIEQGQLLARLAATQDEHTKRFDQVDAQFQQVDARFQQVDARFEQVDARFDKMDARFDKMDAQFDDIATLLMALAKRGGGGFHPHRRH